MTTTGRQLEIFLPTSGLMLLDVPQDFCGTRCIFAEQIDAVIYE